MISILLSAVTGYFLGSVPFGLLAARLKGVDIRNEGSRNIGATNVWRVCGWRYGLPVFLLDALKGVLAVACSRHFASSWVGDAEWCAIAGALGCVMGHSFPLWLKFKGGKGVATSLGALLAMMLVPSLLAFAVWALVFFLCRYVSLASIIAASLFPVLAGLLGARGPSLGFAVVAAALVIMRHRGNIQRLLAGTENRFGKKGGVQ